MSNKFEIEISITRTTIERIPNHFYIYINNKQAVVLNK